MLLKRIAAAAAACILLSAPMLSSGGYEKYTAPASVTAYAEADEDADEIDLLDDADEDDEDYDADEDVTKSSGKRKFNPVGAFVISLIIGLISAWVAVGSMKSKLKTVRSKTGASDYKKKDSLKLNEKSDTFLYKKLEKTPRAQQTNKK